ncbi:hypothetical protein J3E68DRAFT_182874 [Trichoderma sp. SZMC 28012]
MRGFGAKSCPIVESQALAGDPPTSYACARQGVKPPLLFAMLFLASSITHITMDSKWYFPSFAADATDLYPRPKCHPAWVASPPRVVPFLGDDRGRTGLFSSAIDKQVKKKPLPKVAPLVSVLQEEALLLLLLLRTYSYIQSVLPLPGTQRASCHPSSPTIPNGILLTRALRQRSGLRACEDD